MSRFTFDLGNGCDIAYGLDHAVGYFFQKFDAAGEVIVDLDLFDGLDWMDLEDRIVAEARALDADKADELILDACQRTGFISERTALEWFGAL